MTLQIRLGLLGAGGKMGQILQQLVAQEKSYSTIFQLCALPRRSEPLDGLFACDAVIDFSLPEGLRQYLNHSLKLKQKKLPALVSGTTGLKSSDMDQLKDYARYAATFHAHNLSLGIPWLLSVFEKTPSTIREAAVQWEIEETHHQWKKDAPSGTALSMQSALQCAGIALSQPIRSHREGSVVGTHTLTVRLPNEMITIRHEALDRRCFAEGALEATKWLLADKRRPGLYTHRDMLGT